MTVLKRGPKRKGATAVEFAMVMPVYLILLLGMLESARMGMAIQAVTAAARQGCRVAALPGNTAATAQSAVNAVLNQSGLPSATITLNPADPTTAAGGAAITLTFSIPYSQVSWLSNSIFANIVLYGSATFASERF